MHEDGSAPLSFKDSISHTKQTHMAKRQSLAEDIFDLIGIPKGVRRKI